MLEAQQQIMLLPNNDLKKKKKTYIFGITKIKKLVTNLFEISS